MQILGIIEPYFWESRCDNTVLSAEMDDIDVVNMWFQ